MQRYPMEAGWQLGAGRPQAAQPVPVQLQPLQPLDTVESAVRHAGNVAAGEVQLGELAQAGERAGFYCDNRIAGQAEGHEAGGEVEGGAWDGGQLIVGEVQLHQIKEAGKGLFFDDGDGAGSKDDLLEVFQLAGDKDLVLELGEIVPGQVEHLIVDQRPSFIRIRINRCISR